jgi:hypothetical protein
MSEATDKIRRGGWRARAAADSETGQVVLEYTLLLATFGIPMVYMVKLLLGVLAGQYAMVTFLETLPLP